MTQLPDNRLVLRRATETCKTLDSLRYKLHILQKKIAKARTTHPSTTPLTPATQDQVMTGLLNEACTLQFQISVLLAATEEPIPERQRIPTSSITTREQEHATISAPSTNAPVA
ncbi:hypothetical protein BG015_011195 [Linnemannia schmuckeri]|uniref:Uncharacterized protein n=1 Tax=Linnemannia schmuckeri TaxID=64567 RepID=A0A9P5S8C3_9FUNG|nr:hypothetical protein BG015_011195 [Linnemannia schmuckeri]